MAKKKSSKTAAVKKKVQQAKQATVKTATAGHNKLLEYLTYTIIALLAAVLGLFFFTDPLPGGAGNWGTLWWAFKNKPQIIFIVGVVTIGPMVSLYLIWHKGMHRWFLALSWVVFITLILMYHREDMLTILTVAWRHG